MVINFRDSNVCKIDSVCKWLKKNMSKPEDFTRGNLRDYIVDTIISRMSEDTIKKCLISACKENKK